MQCDKVRRHIKGLMDLPCPNATPAFSNDRENDSGYGSNGSDRAASPGIRPKRAPPEGIQAGTTANSDETETVPEPPPPCPPTRRLPKPFPLASRNDLFLLDQPLPASVRQRWLNIQGPLSSGLPAALRESDESSKQASMRLVMLGKSDSGIADASPSIVVFCVEAQWKRVKKYFEQRNVRDLYRSSEDPCLPLFDVYLGPPLKLRVGQLEDGVDVFMPQEHMFPCELDPRTRMTFCGAPITLRHSTSRSTRTATLGGIIKVTSAENQVQFYGVTAGHTIPRSPSAASAPSASISESVVLHADHADAASGPTDRATRWALEDGPFNLGRVRHGGPEQVELFDDRYYDWALCDFPVAHLGPNYLPPRGGPQPHVAVQHDTKHRFPELQTIDTTFTEAVEDIPVVAITGFGGQRRGGCPPCPAQSCLSPALSSQWRTPLLFPMMVSHLSQISPRYHQGAMHL